MKLLPKANGKREPWECLQRGSGYPDTRYFQRSRNLAKREVCFYSHSAGTEPCDLSSYKAEKENTKQSNLFFSAKGGKNDDFNDFSHPSRSSKTSLRSRAERMNYRWSFQRCTDGLKYEASCTAQLGIPEDRDLGIAAPRFWEANWGQDQHKVGLPKDNVKTITLRVPGRCSALTNENSEQNSRKC